jgi:hypothetical protein
MIFCIGGCVAGWLRHHKNPPPPLMFVIACERCLARIWLRIYPRAFTAMKIWNVVFWVMIQRPWAWYQRFTETYSRHLQEYSKPPTILTDVRFHTRCHDPDDHNPAFPDSFWKPIRKLPTFWHEITPSEFEQALYCDEWVFSKCMWAVNWRDADTEKVAI